MKELTFRETQLAALEVLKKIDEICSANDIQYYLFYGTLLGAIRHKGIIPWDDDIDIIMFRPEYEKFVKYCDENKELIAPFKLMTHHNSNDYPYMIGRLFDSRYMIESKNEKPYGIGVFVDIYIFDGMGKTTSEAAKTAFVSDKLSSMCFLSTRKKFARDNTHSTLRMIIKFPTYLVAKAFGKQYWMKKLEKQSLKYSLEDSKYVGSATWLDGGLDDVYPKEWFENPIRIDFEQYKFLVPKNYDEVLTHHYNDYMQIPDEKHRQVHHDYKTYRIDKK